MTQCQTCIQAASCTSCKPGTYLYAVNGTCSVCTALNEAVVVPNCVNCDSTCLTCKGTAATDCLTCDALSYLGADGSCVKRVFLTLTTAVFSNEQTEAVFTFDRDIVVPSGVVLKDNCEVAIFLDPVDAVRAALSTSQGPLALTPGLKAETQFTVEDFLVQSTRLRVKTKITKTVKDAVFVVRFKKAPGLHQVGNKWNTYPDSVLLVDKVNVVVTNFDGAMNAAAGGVQSTVSTATSAMFLISMPQAFILMKVFQTVDFYIFIDCEYPPNFSKFLDIISKNVMDYIPNFLASLADDDGSALYPRFIDFGEQVHVFQNLGSLFTLCLFIVGLKLVFFGLHKAFPKVKRLYSKRRLTQNSTAPSAPRSSSE